MKQSIVNPKADVPARRKPGRPRHDEVAITPEKLQAMAEMYLRGQTLNAIARALGVNPGTVKDHLERHLRPMWVQEQVVRAEEELAKVSVVERVAWEKFTASSEPVTREMVREELTKTGKVAKKTIEMVRTKRTGEVVWLDIVKWAIEFRCKLTGLMIDRHEIKHSGGIRLAGQAPDEFDKNTMGLLLERIAERRRYQEAIRTRLN